MSYLAKVMVAIAAVAVIAVPTALAQSTPDRYSHAYYAAHAHFGAEAVGRNIRRNGLANGHKATNQDYVRSLRVLNGMLHPPHLKPVDSLAPTQSAPASTSSSGPTSSSSSGSSGGGYCGAYQFDEQTWHSVGMSGSPCGASQEAQDQAASKLRSQRGNNPWPTCGAGGASLAQIKECESGGRYSARG